MKYLFSGLLVGLIAMSIVAWRIQPKPPGRGKVVLTWVSDDNPARREQIALFNQLNPDYYLRLDPTNTGTEKVIVGCIGGVGPDLFDCYDGFQLSAYVKSGIAWDVTDALAESGIDARAETWAASHPNFILEDRVYGFPTNASVNAVWFNKDIFEERGIPLPEGPWTWDQFLPLAQQLTVRDANGRIKHFGFMFDWWNWEHFCRQWGGRVYTEDGTRCILDSPENIAAVQLMQDLLYTYKVTPNPVEEAAMSTQGGWGSGTITYFGGGKAAMALGGRWWLCTLRQYNGLRLGAVECPHGPLRVFRGYGRATLINQSSPRRDQALQFLRYLAGKPYNDLVNHQADALAPVKRYCYTPEYLRDPDFPAEDFNTVWRDVMDRGIPDEVSPFVNGNVASRLFSKQLDLVKNGQKTAAEALKAAALKINKEILKSLDRDPSLRERYRRLVGGGNSQPTNPNPQTSSNKQNPKRETGELAHRETALVFESVAPLQSGPREKAVCEGVLCIKRLRHHRPCVGGAMIGH